MNAPVLSVASYRAHDHSTLQAQLTVGQIMTPRSAFLCALEGQSVDDAFRDVPDVYDTLPVIEGNDPDDTAADVVGIIDRREVAAAYARKSVAFHMKEIDGIDVEETLPLLDFAATGRVDALTLVKTQYGSTTCGLVTIHDLQRLPVRIAMFAALTVLEEDIAALLNLEAPDPSEWPRLVKDPKGSITDEINKGIARASRRDDLGSLILAVSFGVKLALLDGLKANRRLGGIKIPNLRDIQNIRNDIAHGRPFERIQRVPSAARDLRELHSSVEKFIARQS